MTEIFRAIFLKLSENSIYKNILLFSFIIRYDHDHLHSFSSTICWNIRVHSWLCLWKIIWLISTLFSKEILAYNCKTFVWLLHIIGKEFYFRCQLFIYSNVSILDSVTFDSELRGVLLQRLRGENREESYFRDGEEISPFNSVTTAHTMNFFLVSIKRALEKWRSIALAIK